VYRRGLQFFHDGIGRGRTSFVSPRVNYEKKETKPVKRERKKWCKDWLLKRATYSHVNLLNELKFEPEDFKNYVRMDEKTYLELLSMVTPMIKKEDTVMRKSISAHERLSVTLRFLATGRSYEDLTFSSVISPQALGKIIPETCQALYQVLRKDYLKVSN